jgi:hypothetical protein
MHAICACCSLRLHFYKLGDTNLITSPYGHKSAFHLALKTLRFPTDQCLLSCSGLPLASSFSCNNLQAVYFKKKLQAATSEAATLLFTVLDASLNHPDRPKLIIPGSDDSMKATSSGQDLAHRTCYQYRPAHHPLSISLG